MTQNGCTLLSQAEDVWLFTNRVLLIHVAANAAASRLGMGIPLATSPWGAVHYAQVVLLDAGVALSVQGKISALLSRRDKRE